MTPDLIKLAKRVVACKGWRWMPGMADCWGGRVRDGDGLDRAVAFPDLSDPATLGCLLALVREAFGTAQMHVYHATCAGDWVVHHPDPPRGRGPTSVRGLTEAEALVKALESAP